MKDNKTYFPTEIFHTTKNSNNTKIGNNNNNNNNKNENSVEILNYDKNQFIVYKIRWGVLFSLILLNISNSCIWINNFPTTTTIANYYHRPVEAINWFSLIYFILAIPGAFVGSFYVDKWGLRNAIWTGCGFNFLGAALRAIATSGLFPEVDTQFIISLCGQVSSGIAQNFILYLHTKVSQTWFPEHQRGIATTILAISNPMGVVITQVTVPYIITSEEDVPFNDKIWLGVAGLTLISTFVFVRRSTPKTPPSHSVCTANEERPSYSQQLKIAFTTPAFLLLLLSLGAGIGFIMSFPTVTQQIICPLGYSEAFGGIINATMLVCGFIGSGFAGVLLDRSKMYIELTMYLMGASSLCGIILIEFLLVPNRQVGIILSSALFGLFGLALLPVGLELAVEATFPVEETITTAFTFLFGQLQGMVIIIIIPLLAREKSDTSLSVCGLESGNDAKDYTVSLLVTLTFVSLVLCLFILCFKTDYKRQNAERLRANKKTFTRF